MSRDLEYALKLALDGIIEALPYLLIGIILLAIIRARIPGKPYSRWKQPVEGMNYSALEFYKELTILLQAKEIPGLSIKQVTRYEGLRFLSARRLYLRVAWKDKVFDICAAPFAKDFFFSYWLYERYAIWEVIISYFPFGKRFLEWINPLTFYRVDTLDMYHSTVHSQITAAVSNVLEQKGLREHNIGITQLDLRDPFPQK